MMQISQVINNDGEKAASKADLLEDDQAEGSLLPVYEDMLEELFESHQTSRSSLYEFRESSESVRANEHRDGNS